MSASIFDTQLDRNPANYVPLSPISFLHRTARVFPERVSVIHGARRYRWRETATRCARLASALRRRGVGKNDTVAVMAPNIPELYELHFAVPMAEGVLNTINTRLDPATVAFILNHGEAKVLLVDREVAPVVQAALERVEVPPLVVDIDDSEYDGAEARIGALDYDQLLAEGDPDFAGIPPGDEWDAIALNYTSGTTGDPKGVVYHHRGAYLNAVNNVLAWQLPRHPIYLWTLPMFHCNGWCFPWTLAAMAGTSVCLRRVSAKTIYDAIATHRVTHFCGAPVVLNFVINADDGDRRDFTHTCYVMTAAAPPPAPVLQRMQQSGFDVTHVYGLTEVYGPAAICEWHRDWDALPIERQAALKARQGVNYHLQEGMMVADPDTLAPVPHDGSSLGEIFFRGNITMKGYLKNPAATAKAFAGGWFHSGDLAVVHPDGYLQIRDRSKDIIISGGENISSVEVEDVLYGHPAVAAAAVVAKPDPKWGETPCAFIERQEGHAQVDAAEIIAYCRERLAHFKCPRQIVFTDLPKTSTGKIQKNLLRARAQEI